jgi:hypothetical protein
MKSRLQAVHVGVLVNIFTSRSAGLFWLAAVRAVVVARLANAGLQLIAAGRARDWSDEQTL